MRCARSGFAVPVRILSVSNESFSGSRSVNACAAASALRARRCDISKRTRRLLPGPCSGSQSIVDHLAHGDYVGRAPPLRGTPREVLLLPPTSGWGARIRTWTGGSKGRCATIALLPKKGNRESTTPIPAGQIALSIGGFEASPAFPQRRRQPRAEAAVHHVVRRPRPREGELHAGRHLVGDEA